MRAMTSPMSSSAPKPMAAATMGCSSIVSSMVFRIPSITGGSGRRGGLLIASLTTAALVSLSGRPISTALPLRSDRLGAQAELALVEGLTSRKINSNQEAVIVPVLFERGTEGERYCCFNWSRTFWKRAVKPRPRAFPGTRLPCEGPVGRGIGSRFCRLGRWQTGMPCLVASLIGSSGAYRLPASGMGVP